MLAVSAVTLVWLIVHAYLARDRVTVRETHYPHERSVLIDRDWRWCLAQGEHFPPATGRWEDAVHGGLEATGSIRYDSDRTATFVGDASSDVPTALVRCP